MEVTGLNPLGFLAAFAGGSPPRNGSAVNEIPEAEPPKWSGARGDQPSDQGARTTEARDLMALRREMERRALPAGPPPAFQLNLLDAERGLDRLLARLEAARTHDRDAPAFRLPGSSSDASDSLAAGARSTLPDADPPPQNLPQAPRHGPPEDRPRT